MLVTSYPVNCVTSSVAEHRQTLDIETTLTETFLPSLATDQGDTSAAAAPGQDLFSAHFEADIQRALAEAESGKESGPEEAAWWRGEEQRAADTAQPGWVDAEYAVCAVNTLTKANLSLRESTSTKMISCNCQCILSDPLHIIL